jgi:hypothetical protein
VSTSHEQQARVAPGLMYGLVSSQSWPVGEPSPSSSTGLGPQMLLQSLVTQASLSSQS